MKKICVFPFSLPLLCSPSICVTSDMLHPFTFILCFTAPVSPSDTFFNPSFTFSPHLFFHQFSSFVSLLIFQPVTSEMDLETTSGISSTISVPSCPPLTEPSDRSVPSSLRTQPPSTAQQARPSVYAYSLPAFTRAHPPALPKIFQPSAGSGISQQMPLVLYGLLSLRVRLFW